MKHRHMYIVEICNEEEDGIRYIAIAEKTLTKEDITEHETLTEKGKTKFGLAKTDTAKIVGFEEFDIDAKTLTAKDCRNFEWEYISEYHRWDCE